MNGRWFDMATRKKQVKNQQQVDISTVQAVMDDEHSKLIDWVNESDDATLESRELSERCREYYDSKQITADERKTLKDRKQAPVVINRIKPKMDSLMGMEKAARTTAKAFPRTPKHAKGADAATEAIRFVLQDNFFDQTRSAAWENILIEGTCGAEVLVKPKGDDYKIVVRHLMWDRLIYDPHSRRKDFSDARYLGQVVWMDYDEAVAMYPDAKDILETMVAGSSTYDDQPRWMDSKRRRVKIVEMYYRKSDGEVWYACFTYGGYCEQPKISPFVNEEGETEWPYEFASAFVTREGNRYGAVMQLLDVQDEINKRRSKALHLMSVRQVRGERGAVEDVNKARAELAKPDGYIETTPGMEFEVLKTGDMATAQFQLLSEAKQEIDAVGANAAVQGKDNSVQSGIALRERKMAGQTEIGPMFDVLRYWQHRMFRKVWNRIKQYWKAEKWIRVTDDEHNLRWVGLNKPMTRGEMMIEQATDAGAPPEAIQQMQQQIAMDPSMQQVVSTANDIADLDMDIIIDEVPDVLNAQIEDFQTLGEMVKSGFQIPPIAVIEASPLSNKDKIIKMMKEQPQMSPEHQKQMEGMQKQMQDIQKQAQQLAQENQALKQDQQIEQATMAAKQRGMEDEFRLKAQAQERELALMREQAIAKHNLEREIAEKEAETAIFKAELDAATRVRVAQINADAKEDKSENTMTQ